MNSDSFASRVGGTGRNQLLPLTGIATSETIFTMGADTGSVNAYVQVPQGNEIVGASNPVDINAGASKLSNQLGMMTDYRGLRGAPYFNSSSFDGHPFLLQISGKYTASSAATVATIKLYQNSTAALGGNAIFTAASSSQGAGNYNFIVQATLLWDSTSQKLAGEAWGNVGGTYVTRATATTVSSVTLANLLFVASITFGAGAANTVTPVEFSISQL